MIDVVDSVLRRRVTAAGLALTTVGLALATAGTASAEETSTTAYYNIRGLESMDVDISCPPNAPYLVYRDYAPTRQVGKGIEVKENGGIGVNMTGASVKKGTKISHTGNPYSTDIFTSAAGTATNWSRNPQRFDITAHCTSVAADGWDANGWG